MTTDIKTSHDVKTNNSGVEKIKNRHKHNLRAIHKCIPAVFKLKAKNY